MNIGELRHPLEVWAEECTQDPQTGAMVCEWGVVGQAWGKVTGVRGREFLAASATQAEVQYRITVRYDPTLTPLHRLRDPVTGITYELEALLPDNERRVLVCMAKTLNE